MGLRGLTTTRSTALQKLTSQDLDANTALLYFWGVSNSVVTPAANTLESLQSTNKSRRRGLSTLPAELLTSRQLLYTTKGQAMTLRRTELLSRKFNMICRVLNLCDL